MKTENLNFMQAINLLKKKGGYIRHPDHLEYDGDDPYEKWYDGDFEAYEKVGNKMEYIWNDTAKFSIDDYLRTDWMHTKK